MDALGPRAAASLLIRMQFVIFIRPLIPLTAYDSISLVSTVIEQAVNSYLSSSSSSSSLSLSLYLSLYFLLKKAVVPWFGTNVQKRCLSLPIFDREAMIEVTDARR